MLWLLADMKLETTANEMQGRVCQDTGIGGAVVGSRSFTKLPPLAPANVNPTLPTYPPRKDAVIPTDSLLELTHSTACLIIRL